MHGVTKQQILEDFEEFKAYLHQKISAGKNWVWMTAKSLKAPPSSGTISPNTRSPQCGRKTFTRTVGHCG